MERVTVKVRCGSCEGSGLYQGYAEPRDTAVICLTCKGSGCEEIRYVPFTERRRHPNHAIRYVAQSRGTLIVTGVGPAGNERITIDEFYRRPADGT